MRAILNHKSNSELGLEIILFITGLSIPFSYAFNSISIGILFVYSFIWFKERDYTSIFKNFFSLPLLFIIFYIIQIIGIIYSDNFDKGISNVEKSVVFLLMPITFINLSKIIDYQKVKISIYGLTIGVVVILLSAYINILIKVFTMNAGFESLITHFVRVQFVREALVQIHPPYFGLLVVFLMVPSMYINFSKKKIVNSICRNVIILFFLISIYSIASFMSFLLSIILIIVYVVLLFKKNKIKSFLVFFSIFILILIVLSNLDYKKYKFNGESLSNRIEWSFLKDKGDTSRPENWKSVLLVVKNNLFIGIGSDGGINQLQKYRSKKSESYINRHNAHNQYLEVLLRYGIIGLSVYLLIVFQLIKNAMKSENKIFIWFVFVFMVSSLTESYLQRQIGLTFFLFYALLFNTYYTFNLNKNNNNEKSIGT